jgi:hypothetical protein
VNITELDQLSAIMKISLNDCGETAMNLNKPLFSKCQLVAAPLLLCACSTGQLVVRGTQSILDAASNR